MYCEICGDENNLTKVIRFWSPDDGWIAGRLCKDCYRADGKRQPRPTDYAYDKRGEIFADEDEAISKIYG